MIKFTLQTANFRPVKLLNNCLDKTNYAGYLFPPRHGKERHDETRTRGAFHLSDSAKQEVQ